MSTLRDGLLTEGAERVAGRLRESSARVAVYVDLAQDLVRERRLHEAKHLLDRAVALVPGNFLVRLRRAECCAALGLYREGLLDLERARALPAHDLRSVAYHQELSRWVGDQLTRQSMTELPSRRRDVAALRQLPLRLCHWLARQRSSAIARYVIAPPPSEAPQSA